MSIKIHVKTAPTCFGVITIIRERTINTLIIQLKYSGVVNLVVWLHVQPHHQINHTNVF
jgi:hypothetical protein